VHHKGTESGERVKKGLKRFGSLKIDGYSLESPVPKAGRIFRIDRLIRILGSVDSVWLGDRRAFGEIGGRLYVGGALGHGFPPWVIFNLGEPLPIGCQ
jgi:hypothetical protein